MNVNVDPPVDPSATSNLETDCYVIVENIRREEFGVGLSLDAESALLRERQNERMGRALQRLSQVFCN